MANLEKTEEGHSTWTEIDRFFEIAKPGAGEKGTFRTTMFRGSWAKTLSINELMAQAEITREQAEWVRSYLGVA